MYIIFSNASTSIKKEWEGSMEQYVILSTAMTQAVLIQANAMLQLSCKFGLSKWNPY